MTVTRNRKLESQKCMAKLAAQASTEKISCLVAKSETTALENLKLVITKPAPAALEDMKMTNTEMLELSNRKKAAKEYNAIDYMSNIAPVVELKPLPKKSIPAPLEDPDLSLNELPFADLSLKTPDSCTISAICLSYSTNTNLKGLIQTIKASLQEKYKQMSQRVNYCHIIWKMIFSTKNRGFGMMKYWRNWSPVLKHTIQNFIRISNG